MGITVATIAVMAMAGAAAAQQPLLSSQQAKAKAVAILKGDPYGATAADVARTIKAQVLEAAGSDKDCNLDVKAHPAWRFQVVVPKTADRDEIKGYLLVDARTGKMLCAGLPFLD